ncbi:tRNA dihydrouridine synthase DusB [Clostridiales bacterium COT073_COT-073]|nr:tRNA dihydrouridine synthase DusB [Clostridiales bacterium COT073_COT-073]
MEIGHLDFIHGLFMAPMAGTTDLAFRLLCKEQGCELAYTEMVSAKALSFDNDKTKTLLEIDEQEGMAAVQLFGSEPELLAEMAEKIDNPRIALFDVNMGCPVPKIVNNGEGSALMKNPDLVGEIVSAMVKRLKKPVTIKIRKGFDQEHINAVEIAKIAESAGAAAVAVHGRTTRQFYSGKADWEIIRQVKEAVKIPVIGNGDIFSGEAALQIKEITGCDGIMVARGAEGNPWIFAEIKNALEGKDYQKPSLSDRRDMILKHLQISIDKKGEFSAMQEMKKHLLWYTKGLPGATVLRRQLMEMKEKEAVIDYLHKAFAQMESVD